MTTLLAGALIVDPIFYLAAIPAVILTGLAKGGFGGTFSVLALPLMVLVVSPMQAAGIMLPILLAMDAIAVVVWRKYWDAANLKILVVAMTIGTVLGYLTATVLQDGHIRLMVGLIGLGFIAHSLVQRAGEGAATGPNWPKGLFWGTLSGLTSFISHVGGPPIQVYLVPQRLSKELFVGTMTMIFAFVNVLKIVPFWALGQLSPTNLATSAVLLPVAILSTFAGAWMVKRIDTVLFYRIILWLLFFVSLKLVWDGLRLSFGV
jgi:uncharacterized protein